MCSCGLSWVCAGCHPHSSSALSKLAEVQGGVPNCSSGKVIPGVLGSGLKLAGENGGSPKAPWRMGLRTYSLLF